MLETMTDALIQLTNNKLVASLIPVIVGTGLLSWWLKIRDRRIAVRDESVRFVNETADLLNRGLSPVFRAIWTQSVEKLEPADKGLADLFEHRLSTRAKSFALLAVPEFSAEYEAIVWRLRESVDEFRLAMKREVEAEAWQTLLTEARELWERAAVLTTTGIRIAIRGKHQEVVVRRPPVNAWAPLRNE